MELLSNYISRQIDTALWDPVKFNHSRPPLSHLFFTDDLTQLANANENFIRTIHHLSLPILSIFWTKIQLLKIQNNLLQKLHPTFKKPSSQYPQHQY